MVGTICPMVHGARTKRAGKALLLAHAVGSLSGALVSGAIAGALGAFLFKGLSNTISLNRLHEHKQLAFLLLAALCVLYLTDEMGLTRVPHPQSQWRVPASWRLRRPIWAATIYGFALGGALATPITFSGLYVVIAWSVLQGDPISGGLVFLGFGLGRILPIIGLSSCNTQEAADSRVDAACWSLSLVRFASLCALAFAATILVFNAAT
jgi:sulfite exporter TauE/SafE